MSRESASYVTAGLLGGRGPRRTGTAAFLAGRHWSQSTPGDRYPVPASVREHGDQGAPSDLRAVTHAALVDLVNRPPTLPALMLGYAGHGWRTERVEGAPMLSNRLMYGGPAWEPGPSYSVPVGGCTRCGAAYGVLVPCPGADVDPGPGA
jgi:hypothetical protein